MKKVVSWITGMLLLLSTAACGGPVSAATDLSGSETESSQDSVSGQNSEENSGVEEESAMTQAEKEYNAMIGDLSSFPVNFVYDGVYYSGFAPKYFTEVTRSRIEIGEKICVNLVLSFDSRFEITLKTAYYRGYEAYEYTVYFENPSESENSGVLKYVNAADLEFHGKNAVLKGILGDHGNQYAPYEYDLGEKDVNFTSLAGRATHQYFPYFNLENEEGGALLAIGWGGTWQADFTYDKGTESSRFVGTGTVGLNTYLKPKEIVRTPLIAAVRYYERDEEKAMNAWRKWIVDCNLPKDSADSYKHVQPFTSTMLAYDTGRPNSDGSISEGYDTWKRSLDSYYEHGLTADFRWVDAGWYFDPYGKTVASDWWGTVGTWELDKVKWPDTSFKDSTDYARAHGTKTFLWFEPERVTHLDGMVKNYGYKREWVLSDHGNNNAYLNNLGNKECLAWTLKRIVGVMEENGIDMYREDFNMDPYLFWNIGDGYEGERRKGITENLYMQGHYALFDGIIEYCASRGKCTFVDSCASGGGRNDLETLRRSVPLLRSDSDRTTIELRLAMTTRLVRWIPFTGAATKESSSQLANGMMDTYVLRASMLPHFGYQAAFYHERENIDWETLKRGQEEWKELSQYFFNDFYVLTPQREVADSQNWTVYEYFDEERDSGVIQAFRLPDCEERSYKVEVKGVKTDRYYTIRDIDGINSIKKIKGSALIKGLPLLADDPRTAMIVYVEPYKAS